MHLIYLARITERVRIIPRFRPVHIDGNATDIDFSAVFDLPRLQKEVRTPILEWRDVEVTDTESELVEELGCWNIHHKTWEDLDEAMYLETPTDAHLAIRVTSIQDVSYTRVPQRPRHAPVVASLVAFNERATSLKRLPEPIRSPIIDLARLHERTQGSGGRRRRRASRPSVQRRRLRARPRPPERPGARLHERARQQSVLRSGHSRTRFAAGPVPRVAGRMRRTPEIQDIAVNYTRQLFGVAPEELIPPRAALSDCFAPLSAYERRIPKVCAEILEDTGVAVDRVIIMSEEDSQEWWES
ncbi:hypothetical protein GGX14DRAFT_399835 [Mycena pura]|uniref:Uncharacterized protein n=1 Tax=Mycena pura TaxID=153505 RepID=A0AAD6VAY3_9AGAR|nr:hypothetical protein GGX14DRAFT_399835 [Mycena pura]